jgi:hypothetical protein
MRRPWFELSADVAALFRTHLVSLTERTNAAIRAEFAGPQGGSEAFWQLSRLSTTRAIEGFMLGIETQSTIRDTEVFARVGQLQAEAGRDLEEALSQFRVGAAVVWREVSTLGTQAGFAPELLFEVAEGLFGYIDELSGICARAYADQQAASAGAAVASRSRLAALLLAEPPAASHELIAAADAAGCRLDGTFAAIVVSDEHGEHLRALLPLEALPGPSDLRSCALLPDPDAPGRFEGLQAAARSRGVPATIGPTVPARDARTSLNQARAAHRLLERGVLTANPVLRADRHTLALLLTADPRLTDRLIAERLAPLDLLRDGSRERHERTLRAWLDHQGRLTAVAAHLSIHAKTVKYRMDRIRELFGPQLDDPAARFEIHLALRAREL